jgi:hypothetical protein
MRFFNFLLKINPTKNINNTLVTLIAKLSK